MDLLGNRKLNSTHERWRESIIARDIKAVRHQPGSENTLCDALSRMYKNGQEDNGGHLRSTDVDPGWEASKDLVNELYFLVDDQQVALLLGRFEGDTFFEDILLALLSDAETTSESADDQAETRARKRRAHRADGFAIEDGKLWRLDGKHTRRADKVECVPSSEGPALAPSVHSAGGHFGRDMTILALQQQYFWPSLRKDATDAVTTCPQCKNFVPRLRAAQLQPITRARPFDLVVGDYLALPTGHGGFKTVLLLVDVYSRFLFTFPFREPGTGKTTVDSLTGSQRCYSRQLPSWQMVAHTLTARRSRHGRQLMVFSSSEPQHMLHGRTA